MSKKRLQKLSISGYKSIRELNDFEIRPLNVLIGANGAGKSNLISFFRLLNAIFQKRLQVYVAQKGGADKFLYYGRKKTTKLDFRLDFDDDKPAEANSYRVEIIPTADDKLAFEHEILYWPNDHSSSFLGTLGEFETELLRDIEIRNDEEPDIIETLRSWRIYHFDDTSDTAYMKNYQDLYDIRHLKTDGRNIAPYLYHLQQKHPDYYQRIVKTIQRVTPFFDDFALEPIERVKEEIRLEWREKGSLDMTFSAHDLSDGTLRFICLTTLLMQPELPSLIVIDEPELGLHPFAKNLLAGLLRSASTKTQIIIATQSAGFVSQFAPEDVVIVSRKDGQSTFERLDSSALEEWMQEYSLGELWEKNVIGGRPQRESI